MPYDRYWELHVLHSSGLPHVGGGAIGAWATRKASKFGGQVHWMATQGANGFVTPTPTPIPPIARSVVSAVFIGEIGSGRWRPDNAAIVAWISTTKTIDPRTSQPVDVRGKLRVYVHGDGEGNIYCVAPTDPVTRLPMGALESQPAYMVYRWLHANDLRPPAGEQPVQQRSNGLTHTSLFSCKAGEGPGASAEWDEDTGTSRPAPGSAVERLRTAFREGGYHGVTITGPSADIAHLAGPNATAVQSVGPLPAGWTTRSVLVGGVNTVEIHVPPGWRLDSVSDARGRIYIPPGYRLGRAMTPSGAVWVLDEPAPQPQPLYGYAPPFGGGGFPAGPPGQYGYQQAYPMVPPPPPPPGPRRHVISGSWVVNLAEGYLVAPLGWDLHPASTGGGHLRSRIRTNVFPSPSGPFAGTPYAGSPFQTRTLS